MKLRPILAAAAVATLVAPSAYAGSMTEPMVDPVVVIPDSPTVGSLGGTAVVTLIAIALMAAAASATD